MKINASTGRKLRYGGVSAALTTLIIAVVIIVNVMFTALAQKFLWYTDLTPEMLYTLSDECVDLIANGDEKFADSTKSPIEMVDSIRAQKLAEDPSFDKNSVMINIIFCTEPDVLEGNAIQRYVYHTALELQKEFPDYIHVEDNNDIVRNPSAVSKYKANAHSNINPSDVIIEFGSEFRVRNIGSFYLTNSGAEEPWAYNGEKAFASSILAVTRAESPVACITINHGETFSDDAFVGTLIDAGYIVKTLDLSDENAPIPENCRLIVVYNPVSDFLEPDGITDIDEIGRLDSFLDQQNSLMVFMDPETPRLDNFEDYLEEWGISFDRHTDESGAQIPRLIMDKTQARTVDGYTFFGDYVTTGLGGYVTKSLRETESSNRVVFSNAMSISYSDTYKPYHYKPDETSASEDTEEYDYGFYKQDGYSRKIYDVFTTSAGAVALANGMTVEKADETNRMSLMTVTVEENATVESNYSTLTEATYVYACGSVDFASSSTMLGSSAYGNTDLLLTVLRDIGREPVPTGLTLKPFADYTIDTITTSEATQYTVVLAVIPAVAALVSGIIVIVRRKNR